MTDPHRSIRHIVFDLGNVLVRLDRETPFRRLLHHLPAERAAFARADRAGFDSLFDEPAEALETGRIDFSRFHEWMCNILGISLGLDEFRFIWCDMFKVDEKMVDLGKGLTSRYDTVLASNTSRDHYEWIITKFPQVEFFRAAALSYELGVMKPDPLYYERLIERFGIDPGRSVFIDDLSSNIAAAVQCGFHGIVFTCVDDLVHRLERLDVRVSGR